VFGVGEADEIEEEGMRAEDGSAVRPTLQAGGTSPYWICLRLVPLCLLIFGMKPLLAQPAPSRSTAPAAAAHVAASEGFQDRIDAAVLALRGSDPKLQDLPKQYVQGLAEFVAGNMLFVLLHELGHATITQMGLPVLGRMEDAADSFATLMLIRAGSDFSHGVLTAAARGWFLADRRDREAGLKLAFYGEHGLNRQRAYQIVCVMVGSDEDKFKDLAEETKLPEARQHTCLGDYSNAAFSWDMLLKPHRRPFDQPKTKFNVVYGPAEGRAKVVERVARSIRLLETVAERASDELAWPAPLTLEMQSCGFPNARWDFRMRTVTLCYELAVEFADLYRGFGNP
jgi:Putative metallopeptidase